MADDCVCSIIPEYLLQAVIDSPDANPETAEAARRTLKATREVKERRRRAAEEKPSADAALAPVHKEHKSWDSTKDAEHIQSGTWTSATPSGHAAGGTSGLPTGGSAEPSTGDVFRAFTDDDSEAPTVHLSGSSTCAVCGSHAGDVNSGGQSLLALSPSHDAILQGLLAQDVKVPSAAGVMGKTSIPSQSTSIHAPATSIPSQSGSGAPLRRAIYDEQHRTWTPRLVLSAQGPWDVSVTRAFNNLGIAHQFYKEVFKRNSVDSQGMVLCAGVHWGHELSNAMWDRTMMRFGDGDGLYSVNFLGLDTIGHEFTHGVIQSTCNLIYQNQSGALNEHLADVFGVMMKQWHLNQKVTEASWLHGEDIFSEIVQARRANQDRAALRSLKAPGTAYDDVALGKDRQVAHMSNFVVGPVDEGGVHVNSGIPNKVFYDVAMAMGGYSWEEVGPLWYMVMTARNGLSRNATFQEFADALMKAAKTGGNGRMKLARALKKAWADVGITVS